MTFNSLTQVSHTSNTGTLYTKPGHDLEMSKENSNWMIFVWSPGWLTATEAPTQKKNQSETGFHLFLNFVYHFAGPLLAPTVFLKEILAKVFKVKLTLFHETYEYKYFSY